MSEKQEAPACGRCRFWFHEGTSDSGECRIRAPRWRTANPVSLGDFLAYFPETSKDAWCGEFAPRDTEGT